MPQTKLKYEYLEPFKGAEALGQQYIFPQLELQKVFETDILRQISTLPTFTTTELGKLTRQSLASILSGGSLVGLYDALARQYRKELEEALAKTRGQFIGLGTPGSSAEALAMAEITERALQNLGELYAQLALEQQARQLQAIPLAMQLGLLPYEEATRRISLYGAPAQLFAPWLQMYAATQPQLLAQWAQEPTFWDYLAAGLGQVAGGIATGLGMGIGAKIA